MKHLSLLVILSTMMACTQLKDDYLCVHDVGVGYCTKMISGNPIHVDDQSQLFTDTDGTKYTWSQLQLVSVVMPPGTWEDLKNFILDYCHENPDDCDGAGQWTSLSMQIKSMDSEVKKRMGMFKP